ncbi:MAG: N-acetylmuramidase domain-containing protein [Rhizobiaceae bacterium]|nr:N-acetylmuramidase domain-containing protein [Rhizobiaceae bacterium]
MITADILRAARSAADKLRIELAAMLAVIEIESAFRFFETVNGRPEPVIRWEGHYFDRRLSGKAREEARAAGLAHPTAGAIKNPKSQAARWAMLTRALEINARAAFESASYGGGQVMGANWKSLNYASVDALVNAARSGVDGQIDMMARFIEVNGLTGALKRRDWAAFARGYNGPAFAKHGYHTKLKAAYERYIKRLRAAPAAAPSAAGMLRLGSSGARVRELQHLLVRAGYSLKVDGDYGPATHDAVRAFQERNGLEVDGVAGPLTVAALDRYRQGASDRPGEITVSEVAEVRDASKGAVAVGLVTAVRDQVAEGAMALIGIESETAQLVANMLLAGASLAGVGLAGWALWGWLRSRRTVEAPA